MEKQHRNSVKTRACAEIEEFFAFLAGDRSISEWDKEYFSLHRDRYGSILDDVDRYSSGKKVLEVGSVPCHFTVLLKMAGYDVTGVDPHPERAQPLIDHFSLDVIKKDIEVEKLPFKDSSFKTIVFCEVLEHMYIDPLHALSELARVLAPGGRLLVYTDNLYSMRTFKKFFLGEGITDVVKEWTKLKTIGHRGHIRLYSTKEVSGLLSLAGLSHVEHRYYHYNEIKSLKSSLFYRLLPDRLSPNQLVVATKK